MRPIVMVIRDDRPISTGFIQPTRLPCINQRCRYEYYKRLLTLAELPAPCFVRIIDNGPITEKGGVTAPPFHTPPASSSSGSLRLDRKGGPRSVWYCFAPISPPRRYFLPSIPLPQSTRAQSRYAGPTMTRPSREFPPENPLQ